MESFERSGLWWLPGDESGHVAGTLTFTPEDGMRLRTIGGFGDIESWLAALPESFPIILGVTDDRQLITLQHCRVISGKLGIPGFQTLDVRPQLAYLGLHRDYPSELVFNSVKVGYSNLQTWTGWKPLDVQVVENASGVEQLGVMFNKQPTITFPSGIGEISLEVGVSTPTASSQEYALRVIPGIRVTRGTPIAINQWMRLVVRPLQDFFSLAAERAASVKYLYTFSQEFSQFDHTTAPPEAPVQVFFDPLYHDATERELSRDDFLFTLGSLDGRLPSIIPEWLTVREELRTVVARFFGKFYRPLYVENRFMDTMMAIEGYHRLRFSNSELDHDEHEQRIAQILDSAPKQHREWLQGILEYSNEPRLRRRLKDVLRANKPLATELIGNSKERDRFVTAVVDTRNSQVHPEDSPRRNAVGEPAELHFLTEQLSWLFKACLLSEIGFNDEKVVELIGGHKRFRHTAHDTAY